MQHGNQLKKVPYLAWPTLLLLAVVVAVWASGVALVQAGHPGWGLLVLTLAGYWAFTPMHDASHRSVAKAGWINELTGRICATVLLAPFPAFRYVHLRHHQHTNHPEKDPDYWSGRYPLFFLPLRWLTQDFHYYAIYLPKTERPFWERVEAVGTIVLIVLGLAGLVYAGFTSLVIVWAIASRLAICFLAFSFDYLPHRPHQVLAKEDRFAATVILKQDWLTPILLGQNYHLVHHLYPAVPFYHYRTVWKLEQEELRKKGAVEVSAFTPRAKLLHQSAKQALA